MSGASAATWIENSREQARLQRSDADDEERAEADGEQDDARLVARPRQMQHGVAERERRACASGAMSAMSARPASCSTRARPANPTQTTMPTLSDAACHAVSADERAATTATIAATPVQSCCRRRASLVAQQQRRLDEPRTCSSGTIENSSDTSTPMPTPWTAALHVTP